MPGLSRALSIVFASISCLLLVGTLLSLIFHLDLMVTAMCAIFAVATAFSAFTYRAGANE
ncbi:MAG: hypothetical protein ABSE70_09370 [Candidatus Limnocylindrales bacterium]